MRLKRLEVKGFKSFAVDTVLHFNEKITGIVGPNGSGKSNIVDAIRWVLGEQKTTELRLERMGDVLFNGTNKRRQAAKAQVSVTFENDKGILPSEYTEITISRLLFRSGESEYRLNNVICRLKDIQSLLMDSGIGSNSYAIIALGMVDDILSDKDQARRKMFEQAAGISKFKVRKQQTLRKLKNANQDIERVEDLLHEIAANLRHLKRQAAQAEKYLECKNEYRHYSIVFAVTQSKSLREKYKGVGKKISDARTDYESFAAKIQALQAEIEKDKSENLTHEENLSENQKQINQLREEIQTVEKEGQMAEQRVAYNTKRLSQIEESIQAIVQRESELQSAIESLRKKVKKTENELQREKEELHDILQRKEKSDQEYADVRTMRNHKLEQQQEAEKDLIDREKKQAILQSRIQSVELQIKEASSLMSNEADLQQKEQQEAQRHKTELTYLIQQEQDLQKLRKKRKLEIERLDKLIEDRKDALSQLYRSLDATKHDYELTKSVIDNLEGFPASTKYLRQHQSWKVDAPLFSDILYCEEQYRAALENYIEPYLSYFIVEHRDHAIQAIQLLKEAQKGKSHFFIAHPSQYKSEDEHEVFGAISALDVIDVEPQYKGLVHSLLCNVYIVKEKDGAEQILSQNPHIVLLHEDGSIIWKKNQMIGGSTGLFEGKRIGRKKNLEKLKETLSQLKQEVSEAERWVKQQKEKRLQLEAINHSQAGSDLEKKIQNLRAAVQKNELRIESLWEQQNKRSSAIKNWKEQVKQWRAEELTQNQYITTLHDRIASLRGEAQKADLGFNSIAEKSSKISERYNQKQIETIKLENTFNQWKRELNYRITEKDRFASERIDRENELEELKKSLAHDKHRIKVLEQQLVSLYEKQKDEKEKLSSIERTYFEARNYIIAKEKKLSEYQRNQQQQQELINTLKDAYNEMKLSLHSISERLKIEFSISLSQAEKWDLPDNVDLEETEIHLQKLTKRLQNFGDVNPMAVEAYREMKERHDLIAEQRKDILDAQKQLEKTIAEIENTATNRFLSSFEEVRTNFVEVFRTLFTADDTADLILSMPENPLDSSIEIIAKPKGKRPKSLSQLSGGEKTLTATALLFALYLTKPAPFCIFDEVDAPLDDANIEKFNKIIQRFSDQSQFIIVTHNKNTMAAVDIIYGVYMNEPGVSGVSAVDFRDLAHRSLSDLVAANT